MTAYKRKHINDTPTCHKGHVVKMCIKANMVESQTEMSKFFGSYYLYYSRDCTNRCTGESLASKVISNDWTICPEYVAHREALGSQVQIQSSALGLPAAIVAGNWATLHQDTLGMRGRIPQGIPWKKRWKERYNHNIKNKIEKNNMEVNKICHHKIISMIVL